jgi:hypothetical protein
LPAQAAKFIMDRRYHCFLSYRHADNRAEGRQWATWLHQRIETYEVPADLVGTKNDRGGIIPSRIFPVFRDEEELPADADLSQPIAKALENSETLLVLCSPGAATSRFVAEEIVRFKSLGRKDRVLAAILSGEPNATAPGIISDRVECFPQALRCEVDENGNVTSIPAEPIAADFRLPDGHQGWTNPEAYRETLVASGDTTTAAAAKASEYAARLELMVLKIVAGILGVSLGLLTQRDKAYQLTKARRRVRTLAAWLAVVAVFAAVALVAGLIAVRARMAAVALAEQRLRDSDALSAAIAPLTYYGVFQSPDVEMRSRVMEMIQACGGVFQLRHDPQSLEKSLQATVMCQMIASAAIETGDNNLFAVLRGETLSDQSNATLHTALTYAESMASIFAAIASRPTLEVDLQAMKIDQTAFSKIRSETKMLKGALHLYTSQPREAERELAAFVAEMQEWEPPTATKPMRDLNLFEAASNLSHAYRLNGKPEEAIRTAAIAVDSGEKWAGSEASKQFRVAGRCVALDHFGLLDEPHQQRQKELLQKLKITEEDVAEMKALLEGRASPAQ